jgi:hypothetical protein
MVVRHGKCSDPRCDIIHVEAFHKADPGPGTAAHPSAGKG